MIGRPLRDLTGQRFKSLTVLELASRSPARWLCLCDCGNRTVVMGGNLVRAIGGTRSCGCALTDHNRSGITHGESSTNTTPEYRTWNGMRQRCNNPRSPGWARYGGRGICVCDSWNASFEAFLHDMGRRPSRAHSLDRIDNDGPYSPGNCQWATAQQQAVNRRDTFMVSIGDKEVPVSVIAQESGIHVTTIKRRIRRGVPALVATTSPPDPRKSRPQKRHGATVKSTV